MTSTATDPAEEQHRATSPKAVARRKAKERAQRLRQNAEPEQVVPSVPTEAYRVSHILIKHSDSARQASWRDPDGKQIRQRTLEAAEESLSELLDGLHELDGQARAALFAQLAGEVSDCGSARDGGGGDLGELEAGEMDEAFEEAVFELPVWGLSGVVETESGSHIVLRTPVEDVKGDTMVRSSHILIKYDGSARQSSWRDPEGKDISRRSNADAEALLDELRGELAELEGQDRLDRFAELAGEVSDCGSARAGGGGDLGEMPLSEMAEEIAEVFEGGLDVGDVSDVVETQSGLHIVMRTEGAADGDGAQMYRMMHILLKHQGSARQSSWRDPDGKHIRQRTREAAAGMLRELLQDVYTRNGGLDRAERFAQLAGEVSDCGSARDGGGGDLGELEAGEMDEAFEEAVFELPVWGLSGVVETESGSHIVLRTPVDYKPVLTAAAFKTKKLDEGGSSSSSSRSPELGGLAMKLRGMALGEVKARARYAGVREDRVESAIDDAVDDPKASVIELVLSGLTEMKEALSALRMGELKDRAVQQAGLDVERVDTLIDEAVGNPKAELIQLIMDQAMHPPDLDPAVIEKKRQAMAQAAAEEEAARNAAEEAEREHQAAKQAAAEALAAAEKEEQESAAAAAAAAQEEAEAAAAEQAAATEEAEAIAAEATAAKELQDVEEAERILAEKKASGDAEEIAQAEVNLAREKAEAAEARAAAERERAEADDAATTAERERAEAEEAKQVAAKEKQEAEQAKLEATTFLAQEAEAKQKADAEAADALEKAKALDEASQALSVDIDGMIRAGEPEPEPPPPRLTAEELEERYGWPSLHDAIADSAGWDQLREILAADPQACTEESRSTGVLPLHALLTMLPRFKPAVGMRLRAKKRPLGHRNMSGDTYYPCDVLDVSDDGRTMTVSYPDEGKYGIEDDALPIELLEPSCAAPPGGSAANVPIDLVEQMIVAHPAACQTKDPTGKVPVQHAMKNGASMGVVRALRFTGSPTLVFKHKEKVGRAMGRIRTLKKMDMLTPSLSNLGKAMQMEQTQQHHQQQQEAMSLAAGAGAAGAVEAAGAAAEGEPVPGGLTAAEVIARKSLLSLPGMVEGTAGQEAEAEAGEEDNLLEQLGALLDK
jgi:parvulin-like peptidyl-prolyl isomerase/chemotaxis protein histidine kinase CheA